MEFKFSISKSVKKAASHVLDKLSQSNTWYSVGLFGNSRESVNLKHLIDESFGYNPYAYSIINDVAATISRFPIGLRDKNSLKDISDKNGILKLITSPNKADSTEEFIYKIAAFLDSSGNAFILKQQSIGFKEPANLEVLHSGCVEILFDSYYNEIGYKYTYENKQIKYGLDEIIHIKYSNIVKTGKAGHYGYAPLESGRNVVKASNSIFEAENFYYENNGAIGILSPDGDAAENSLMDPKELQTDWELKSSGTSNRGKVIVSQNKVKYTQIGTSPKDMLLYQNSLAKLKVICSILGVPSVLFGDDKSSTYNNVETAIRIYYTKKLLPMANFILNALTAELFDDSVELYVDKDKISELSKVNVEYNAKILSELAVGIHTVDEAKKLLGY